MTSANNNSSLFFSRKPVILVTCLLLVIIGLVWRLCAEYATIQLTTPISNESKGASTAQKLPMLDLEQPLNIIYLIADGAGLNHYGVSRVHHAGKRGKLSVDRMPIVGLMTTHAHNYLITDSAAAATAMATGYKVNKGSIGIKPDGTVLDTLFDDAQALKKLTGLIATSKITDATPASFYAHVSYRGMVHSIANQLPESGLDLVLGGGFWHFVPKEAGGTRSDKIDVIGRAKKAGYQLVRSRAELLSSRKESGKLLGLLPSKELKAASESTPALPEMVDIAIERLSQSAAGFVLVVESSLIDDASHERDIQAVLREMAAFDQALSVILSFAEKDQNTLVVVTSDHETGGLLMVKPVLGHAPEQLNVSWNAGLRKGEHTGGQVPVFAFGPGAKRFTGSYDNTDLAKKIIGLLN